MTTETWPPPQRPTDEYVKRPVWSDSGPYADPVRLRLVRLWGREVAIDDAGRVHCHGCAAMVDVTELGSPDNGHPVGLPFRAGGRLRPVAEHGDGGRASAEGF
jgi:hypothetical protein